MIINHNIPGINAYNKNSENSINSSKAMNRLSSGLRVNSAADDAAGLTISEKMKAQIRGISQVSRNVQDGNSLGQTAEGGLNEIEKIVQRMREISVQAANDTLNSTDRENVQLEIEQLKSGIDEIANNTNFNGITLLNRSNIEGTQEFSAVPGSEKQLTSGPRYDTAPSWVGNSIALSVDPSSAGNEKIYVMNSDGTNQTAVISNAISPAISKDGSQIAFIRGNDLWISNIDGTGEVQKTNTADIVPIGSTAIDQSSPSWSDDNSLIYFASNNGIEKLDVATSTRTVIVPNGVGTFKSPSISPDGSKILYEDSSVGKIYIANSDGSGATFIANGHEPTFSPDGSKIAFSDDTDIMVMNVGSSDISNVTQTMPTASLHTHNHMPTWSSDGTRIAFHSDTVGSFGDIWSLKLGAPGGGMESGPNPVILQTGANTGQEFKINLSDVRAINLGLEKLSVTTHSKASAAISTIDQAIEMISSERSKYGRYENALDHISNNASNYNVNLTASESRITDADMAKESMEITKYKILGEASQAMLKQSEELPQQVLQIMAPTK